MLLALLLYCCIRTPIATKTTFPVHLRHRRWPIQRIWIDSVSRRISTRGLALISTLVVISFLVLFLLTRKLPRPCSTLSFWNCRGHLSWRPKEPLPSVPMATWTMKFLTFALPFSLLRVFHSIPSLMNQRLSAIAIHLKMTSFHWIPSETWFSHSLTLWPMKLPSQN